MLVLSRATGEMVEVACPIDLTVKLISINDEIIRPNLVASDEIDDHGEEIHRRFCPQTDRPPPDITRMQGDPS